MLNHTPQDVGKKHYDLYEREREKRRALDMWASALTALLDKDRSINVVPIRSARVRAAGRDCLEDA